MKIDVAGLGYMGFSTSVLLVQHHEIVFSDMIFRQIRAD